MIFAGSWMNVWFRPCYYKEVASKALPEEKVYSWSYFCYVSYMHHWSWYDLSVDLSLISTFEADPFYGRENDDAIEHLTKLTELGGLFTTDEKTRNFYVTKLLPFSMKGDAKAWYDALPCGSIQSPQDIAISFVDKYFPAHMQHAALQRIYNFKQL